MNYLSLSSPLLMILCLFTVSACNTEAGEANQISNKANSTKQTKGVVNVYSARHYDTDLKLYQQFQKKTGIKVNLVEAKSDQLIERIVNEGEFSPADVLITVDAGRLYRAEQRGVFSPVASKILTERIPAHLRHPDGLWFGLSKRARVIIYNKKNINAADLKTYDDLAKPKFKQQVCMRSSSNIYNISLLASLISHKGESKAQQWANGVVSNLYRRPQGNDTVNIRAVQAGQCNVSLVNSYYLARVMAADANKVSQVGIVYPNQSITGTHINISGAGVLKHAPNREHAIQLLEYLTENEAQAIYVEQNHEYPIVLSVSGSSAIQRLGQFKEDTLNASQLGKHQAAAVKAFDKAGWD